MSGGTRSVVMNAEQAELLDELTQRLMREGDMRAMRLGALVMAYKFGRDLEPPMPDNVIPFGDSYSRRVGA